MCYTWYYFVRFISFEVQGLVTKCLQNVFQNNSVAFYNKSWINIQLFGDCNGEIAILESLIFCSKLIKMLVNFNIKSTRSIWKIKRTLNLRNIKPVGFLNRSKIAIQSNMCVYKKCIKLFYANYVRNSWRLWISNLFH